MTTATAKKATARTTPKAPKQPDKPATTVLRLKPPGETKFHDIEVNLLGFTLAERNVAKKALAQFHEPDLIEVMAVNAFVVWRRTHPDAELQDWVEGVTFGDVLNVGSFETPTGQQWLTPEGYDPEA